MPGSIEQTARTRATIELYIEGFNSRDLSRMPIAENVYFKAPVNPEPVVGLAALTPFLERVFATFEGIVVQRIIAEGEYASAVLDYHLPGVAPVPMVDVFRVLDGKVVEILPFFAPSLLRND